MQGILPGQSGRAEVKAEFSEWDEWDYQRNAGFPLSSTGQWLKCHRRQGNAVPHIYEAFLASNFQVLERLTFTTLPEHTAIDRGRPKPECSVLQRLFSTLSTGIGSGALHKKGFEIKR